MQNEQLWISIKWFKYWKFFFHVCEVIFRFKPSTYFILMSGYTANIMDMVDVYDDVNDESVTACGSETLYLLLLLFEKTESWI